MEEVFICKSLLHNNNLPDTIHKQINHEAKYSGVPNKRDGWNKHDGWKIYRNR